MSTIYICDWAVTYESTYTNNGIAAPWGGAAGAVRANAIAVAGDFIHWRNAATRTNNVLTTKLWRVPCAITTNFAVADLATMDALGTPRTGRIAVIVTNDYVLMEEVSGDFSTLGSPDTIETAPGGGNTTLDGTPSQPGTTFDSDFCSNGNITDGEISVAGFASNGTTPEFTYLDCDSTCIGLSLDGVSGWSLRRAEFINPSPYGFWGVSGVCADCLIEDVIMDSAASHGWYRTHKIEGMLTRCSAKNSGGDGWNLTPIAGGLQNCSSLNNGLDGVHDNRTSCVINESIIAGNGSHGIEQTAVYNTTVTNNIIDGNGGSGLYGVLPQRMRGNRITHNGAYGASSTNIPLASDFDHNFYFGNADGSVSVKVTEGPNSNGPAGSGIGAESVTEAGYKTHTFILDFIWGGTGVYTNVIVGDRLEGERGDAATYLGTVVSTPTGDTGTIEFHFISGTVPAQGSGGGFVIKHTEGGGAVFSGSQNSAIVQLTGDNATDYSTAIGADIRRVEIDLGNGSTWITAGLAPPDWSVPAVGVTIEGTDYKDDTLTGTYHESAEAEVEEGVQFGEDGTEYTGTFEGGGAPVGPWSEAWR